MNEHKLKQECALARELMPLEIEGVASGESARYVRDHIAACTDCAIAYGEEKQRQKQAALDAAAKEGERFRRDMRRLKKRRALRRALGVVLAAALALGLIAGGFGLRAYLTDYHKNILSPEECGVTLYRLENNMIVGRYEYPGKPFRVSSGFGRAHDAFSIVNWTSIIRQPLEDSPFFRMELYWQDGKIRAVDSYSTRYINGTGDENVRYVVLDDEEITSIAISNSWGEGKFEEKVIWRAGDDLPLYEDTPLDSFGSPLAFARVRTEAYRINAVPVQKDEPAKEE